MTITVEKPEIITLLFRQEKTDADYGSCLWARFTFDKKNYTLYIDSDCGNYTHGWVPTPEHESFLHLCGRFDCEYLLYKMSNRTIIDSEKTWKAIKELVDEITEFELFESIDEYCWEQIEAACYHNSDTRECFDSIRSVLDDTDLRDKYEAEDIWGAIETDYPANAKKIFSVFINHIQPFIKTMEVEDNA